MELSSQRPPESAAWTEDGYICDQDALHAYTYRTVPACYNGCGPVAVFDLRRHEGHTVTFPEVLHEMDALHPIRVPGPTCMRALRRYLRGCLPGWREVHGKYEALAAAAASRMGILRYHEQHVPHFVPYFRVGENAFRFLNVSDDTMDDVLTPAEFWQAHLLGGSVKLIYWE